MGAVIADGKRHISFGYNGFPSTCEDLEEDLYDRTTKYKLVTHAEVNAIFNSHNPVRGCTIYTYPLPPCAVCSSLLAAGGISRVISQIDPSQSSTPKYLDFSDTEFILNKNKIPFHWEFIE